jgi:citrate lyase gamma subunit
MSDMQRLLINRIRETMEKLSKENVGYINVEDSGGIQYVIDGRVFYIGVKEIGTK